MNPLTQVKRIQKLNSVEASLGISEEASWHSKYKDSAYIFIGGIPFDLTEGDLLAVFAQYGEIMDVNLVRDKGTGKSKGFAFLAYEDQRSTILAVDNLNGSKVLGRIIRVDHVSSYRKKEEEDEEERKKKREARGICRAFQKGECNRGDSCKFSHDEQRAADSPGTREGHAKWGHEIFEEPMKINGRRGPPTQAPERERQRESLPTKKRDGVHLTSMESDDIGGRNNSSRVEDDYRRSRRELDRRERGTTSKESGERRGRSRNQKADVDREA